MNTEKYAGHSHEALVLIAARMEEKLDELLAQKHAVDEAKRKRLLELCYFGQNVPGHAGVDFHMDAVQTIEILEGRLREMREILDD